MLRRFALVLVGMVGFGLLPGVAVALPEGRVYEMVSPPYKGGYGVNDANAVAPDGESAVFGSVGAFAGVPWDTTGAQYVARRGSSGWLTVPATTPPIGGIEDFSANLEYELGELSHGQTSSGDTRFTELTLDLHQLDMPDTPANWEVFGGIVVRELTGSNEPPGLGYAGAGGGGSGDFCHIVLRNTVAGAWLPEALNTNRTQLYDLSRGCDGEQPSLRLVAVRNKLGVNNEPEVINRYCSPELGTGLGLVEIGTQQVGTVNTISGDGKEIFFSTNVDGGLCGARADHQLFVRLGGARTVEVSKPLVEAQACGEEVPCQGAGLRASAYFDGASEDGSRVFFTTTAPLGSEDKDTGNDLYMASIGCPAGEAGCAAADRQVTSLVQVSHGETGEPADVQGVVRVAFDGTRVYFVAPGVLTMGANLEALAPAKGAENLYVYDAATGSLAFVADLCSGPQESGSFEDLRCPSNLTRGARTRNDTSLWGPTEQAVQSTPDGRFLVFSSYARLVKDDTDTARDVYRYDADTGVLDRVSLGENGYEANGNNDAFDAAIPSAGIDPGETVTGEREMSQRAISDDGSRIVFSSVEPLSQDATNGMSNLYEWDEQEGSTEGMVSLVSTGSASTSDKGAVISPSGRDIFFITSAGLVSQDTDGLGDLYDARLGGGFPVASAPRQSCSGDACQGPLTNPAPLLVAGSVSQAAGGNFAADKPVAKKSKKKSKKRSKKKKKLKGKRRVGRAVRVRRGVTVGGRGR